MAERRMFAKTIIDSDAFLDMPLTSQALYFHLSMRADDDGFINNAKKIQRLLGCADDDLKLLLAKNFIIPFQTGVCVIKHWKIHNLIQKDRYKSTVYEEEFNKLSLKNNNVYTMDTECIQYVNALEPQVRLGKSSLGKSSKEKTYDDYPEFLEFWNAYPKHNDKKKSLEAWIKHNPPIDKILNTLTWQKQSKQWKKESGQFIPNGATYINDARWEAEPPSDEFQRFVDGTLIKLNKVVL